MTKEELAVHLKHTGFNCAQSVLCAFQEESGLSEEVLKKAGASFCAGMGGMNGTCGALVAAELLLGLCRYEGKPLLKDAEAIYDRFARKCGATICRTLKGADTGLVLADCDTCVKEAAAIVAEQVIGGSEETEEGNESVFLREHS
ncbi:MAG: C_GCAxxG_C_C family protein [Solobacterium sp.]|nr:C_GCAxxG_C_C family protein [Solobacterium sp.]